MTQSAEPWEREARAKTLSINWLPEYLASGVNGRFASLEVTKVGVERGRGSERKRYGDSRVMVSLITGFDYHALVKRSITALRDIEPADEHETLAKAELEKSLYDTLIGENSSTTDDAYTPLVVNGEVVRGARVHIESGTIYLQALIVWERTISEAPNGPKPKPNSAPKTVAKNKLRRQLPIGRYVSYKLSPFQRPVIRLGGKAKVSL